MYTGFEYDREMTVRHFIIQLKGHCKTNEEILTVLSHLLMYYSVKNKKSMKNWKLHTLTIKGLLMENQTHKSSLSTSVLPTTGPAKVKVRSLGLLKTYFIIAFS